MKSVCAFALLLTAAAAYPQFWNQNPNWNSNQNFDTNLAQNSRFPTRPAPPTNTFPIATNDGSSTTPRPTTPTTASPQYLACLQSCPATSEYNPICGSDNINYHNNGRLDCAVRCGQNVVAVRSGTCSPL
ncbi:uncharacterized protein LOC115632900 [Scaptodrosophila lebanonensis]|uniref:Uncharacterized protein LOC115632900 n=1 Tax=Drosophila lebanonensis TaxID=7225 RepID=A0A6J2UC43_DROLE|nr:uncharacterized protein LOC115632900 [Scaptodrosophila lebanonensis]